jgi:regulator of nonsense transcripts 2
MDIEFIVQDTFSLTRPQWKLATNLDEATKAFQLAIAQDQKNAGLDKVVDPDDADSEASSDDEGMEGDDMLPEADGEEDENSEDEDDNDNDNEVSTCCSQN